MIQVAWDNDDHTIIICTFDEGWSITNLFNALDEVYCLMETVEHEVYVIFDLSEANSLPTVSLSSFKNATIKIHPRIKMFIDVTDSMLIIRLTNMFKILYKDAVVIYMFDSLDEAHQFIAYDMKNTSLDA